MNILFLCTGNSCRSIMAEAILKHLAGAGINVQSAGSKPTGFVHPKAIKTLEEHNISTQGLFSKSWDNLEHKPDVIITLCASAHGETCPSYIGNVIRSHWGMEDPDKADNDELAFEKTFSILYERINKFLAISTPELDEHSLKQHLDSIVNS